VSRDAEPLANNASEPTGKILGGGKILPKKKNKKSKMSGSGNLMEKDLLYGKIIMFKYLRLSTKDIILKLYYLVKEKDDF
jgi:hypothetical protein